MVGVIAGKVLRIYTNICTYKLTITIYYKPIYIYMSYLTYLYKSMENQYKFNFNLFCVICRTFAYI